jgi:hypothetical protein
MKRRAWVRSGAWCLAAVLVGVPAATSGCAGGGGGDDGAPTHLTTAPGAANGQAASATIGADGGTLVAADGGLTITVPPGAVAADTVFTVTPVTAPADNAVATYLLQPEGTTFTVPVTLAFDASGAGVAHPGLAFLAVAVHEAAGTWRWLPDQAKDAGAKTVSAAVSHFSEYSLLSGFQLQPLATVAQVGGAAEFTIVACADPVMLAMINGEYPEDAPGEPPDELLYECKAVYFEGSRADRWSVDGVEGGDASHGTIQANGDVAAVFNAPGEKPDPDVVAVTAWFHYASFNTLQDMLVGRVTITDDEKYWGGFTVSAYGPMVWTEWTATGDAKWTESDYAYEYIVTGKVKSDRTIFPMDDVTCTLVSAEQPFTYDSGSIREMQDATYVFWAIGPLNWTANCCDPEGNCQFVENFLTLTWSSGCGSDWAEVDAAAFEEHGDLRGGYTFPGAACGGGIPGVPNATVEFLFYAYSDPE